MKNREFEAVVFDIDGTLTPHISWTEMTKGLGATVGLHIEIFDNFLKGQISYEEAKGKLLSLWRSTGNAKREFLENLFARLPLRPETRQIVDHLKSKGYLICLISGGIDLHVQKVAQKLDIDYYFSSSELVWDAEGNLIDFHYAFNQGQRKLEQFLKFCQAHNIDPQRCVVVGDDINDLELFIYTGRGISLHSPTSRQIEKRAWKRIKTLEELQELL